VNGCGSHHPTDGRWRCENTALNHALCTAFDDSQFVHIHWECPSYEPPPPSESKASGREKTRSIASRTRPAETLMSSIRATARGSEQATARWTEDEKAQIIETIIRLAYSRPAMTADDIWAACPEVAPGPGIHALLTRAVREKIVAKGDFADSQRERTDHDAGRRLRVWRSLVFSPAG
jgi:hypothetical protein